MVLTQTIGELTGFLLCQPWALHLYTCLTMTNFQWSSSLQSLPGDSPFWKLSPQPHKAWDITLSTEPICFKSICPNLQFLHIFNLGYNTVPTYHGVSPNQLNETYFGVSMHRINLNIFSYSETSIHTIQWQDNNILSIFMYTLAMLPNCWALLNRKRNLLILTLKIHKYQTLF